jgi:hypothetical protein
MFRINKNYSIEEINNICNKNNLATVDCLNDENIISIEKWNDGEGEDCLFEFYRVSENIFRLNYLDESLVSKM